MITGNIWPRVHGQLCCLATFIRENYFGSQDNFIKSFFFFGKRLLLVHLHLTMLFNYTQMKMEHLSQTSPNMSSIKEVLDRLGKTFLTSFVGNHWATGGLRVNSYSGEGGLIIFLCSCRGEYNIADDT